MAPLSQSKLLFFLLLAFMVPFAVRGKKTAHLHFYLHNIVGGPNPTAVKVVSGPLRSNIDFGNIIVIDNPMTKGPHLTSKLMGRAQGSYTVASQDPNDVSLLVSASLVFTQGKYNGSSLAILSSYPTSLDVAELSVVGGTGLFRMAQGYILSKPYKDEPYGIILELDAFVMN